MIAYITGCPGTGKTTISLEISKIVNWKVLNLGELSIEKGFILGFDDELSSYIVDVDSLSKYLEKFLMSSQEKNFIFDSHFIVKVSERFNPLIFVLRCEPFELIKRLTTKGFSKKKVYENVLAEILDFCLYEVLDVYETSRVHEVDTTSKSINDVVNEILAVINGEKKPKLGTFNWIAKLESEGKLEEVLKYIQA
ncbi:MAG: adenylate kinase family protein [Candidatus Bathyarchaeota archaeon]|nr:adenylate kinase family protein [Candidatus Bathyarchaeota archaeon]